MGSQRRFAPLGQAPTAPSAPAPKPATIERRISMLNEISQLQAENAKLRIQGRRMTEEHVRTEKGHAELKLRHEDLQRLYEGSQAQIASLQTEQARLKSEVQVLLSTSEQGKKIEKQEKDQQALRSELARTRAELVKLEIKKKDEDRFLELEKEKFAKAVRAIVALRKGLSTDEAAREGQLLMANFDRYAAWARDFCLCWVRLR